jgi:hypothetical protein
MREFAKLDTNERVEIIRNAAQAKGMAPAIVEKDFWICWTLDYQRWITSLPEASMRILSHSKVAPVSPRVLTLSRG